MDLVYFIVLVGVLIFVHESGHFVWAKLFGVRVLKFSLGFGPRIAGFSRGGTEYVVAAFPLGGYVRMLGEHPQDEVAEAESRGSFMAQSLWKRVVIVCAGPLMNLTFPVLLYFVVFLGQTSVAPAVIGDVFPGQPADGKLAPGDRIVAVDGNGIDTFHDLIRAVAPHAGRTLRFTVERGSETLERAITPSSTRMERPFELFEEVGRIGVASNQPLSVVGITDPQSPAAAAGFLTFDWVIAAGGRSVVRWVDFERVLDHNRGSLMPVTVLRSERVRGTLGETFGVSVLMPRVLTLTPEPGEGRGAQRAGLELSDLYVSYVAQGSAEAEAGLRTGDRLVAVSGTPIRHRSELSVLLSQRSTGVHEVLVKRDGRLLTLLYRPRLRRAAGEQGEAPPIENVAIRSWAPTVPQPAIHHPSPISFALSEALRWTGEVVELTATSFVWLFEGRLSMKSIGGPLQMYDAAGDAARQGAINFLLLMGFISVNLGLINLMPIPMLDGGHLLFFLLELIVRRPLSARFREIASITGLSILILLMVFAFKNDVERQWPQISRGGQEE